jgi:uncharacterized protein (TIGR02302 family)
MTEQKTETRLAAKVRLQRMALVWEKAWAALHWPIIAFGVTLIVLASGALTSFAPMIRIAGLVLMALLCLGSLRDLARITWPSDRDAMRKLEQTAGFPHRKVSSIDETIAPEFESPEATAIWAEHKRRQWAGLDTTPVAPPRSHWRLFDPRALRVPVALGVLASLLLGSGDLTTNLREAAAVQDPVPPKPLTIDAWLKPPAYTGKAPVLLTSPAMIEKLARGEAILVPQNAQLTVRVAGANAPAITFHPLGQGQDVLKDITPKTATTEAGFSAEAKLAKPARIDIRNGEERLASWPVDIIPDTAPTLTWSKPPVVEKNNALTFNWQAKDDYGVRSIESDVSLADAQKDGVGFETNGPFLFDPPKLAVKLKKSNAKDEQGKTTQDLTAHPWAGLNVTVTLTAKDAAGQSSAPALVDVALPERVFVRPLAQALIEQRKRLVLDPEKSGDVAAMINALLIYPEGLTDRSGYLIRLSAISSHLGNAGSNEDIITSVNDLWQLALDLEDGSLADAKAELAKLKKQLEEALRNGASEEEIAKLMEKMRDAMDKYLQAMREQWQKDKQQGKNPRDDNQQQSRELSQKDLQKMLDEIEKLSKQGQKDQAQALLDQLEQMLQNLQPGQSREAGQGDPMGEMMDQLSDMMRQQQRLMDQTQRMPGQGQPGDGEPQPGDGQQPGEGEGQGQGQGQGQGLDGKGLADRQGQLRDLLDRMQRGLGGEAPGELGDAGRAMGDAEESLRNGDREGALQQQSDALDALRKGAQELGRQMRERGQGQARSNGRDGEAGGKDEDPLGRPRATRNPDAGPDRDMVPGELAIRRAREILEQLRAKANGEGLTDSERSYIDRLLRGLY